ncbi:MAG: XdhC family protein [Nitrososphaerota archaeon]|nr:XdhC family protein [Nitrososphaerota archaeon]
MDDFYSYVSEKINHGTRVVVASVLETDGSVPRGQGTKMAIPENGPVWGTIGGGCVEKYVVREAKFVLQDGTTRVEEFDLGDDSWSGIGMSCGGKVKMMLELVEPPERLIIFGSGGISVGCAQVGNMLGYKVIVLDPFATKEAFPGAEVQSQGVLQRIREMTMTPFDNVLILTEHRYDIEALQAVLHSKVRFIGMIGSKNRVNASYKELVKAGESVEKLLAVYAPVGLDLGAVTQQEIAVSIMAEVINARRGGNLAHLKLTKLLDKPEITHSHKETRQTGET